MSRKANLILCWWCAWDTKLSEYIKRNSTGKEATCTVCGSLTRERINIQDFVPDICNLARALFRLRYDSDKYKIPLDILGGQNSGVRERMDSPAYQKLIKILFNESAKINDITLSTEYDAKTMTSSYSFRGIDNDDYEQLRGVSRILEEQGFEFAVDAATTIFEAIKGDITNSIPADQVFYRARIGYEYNEESVTDTEVVNPVTNSDSNNLDDLHPFQENIWTSDEVRFTIYQRYKVPYKNEAISAPPVLKTNQGRANRQYEPHLYLSTDKHTAITEVKAQPGHYVSLATFKPKEPLLIVDLTRLNILDYYQNDARLSLFHLLLDLKKRFAKPVIPEDENQHALTQVFSTAIQRLDGYQGIMFNSARSEEKNFVSFYPDKFEFLSSDLFMVEKLEVSVSKVEHVIGASGVRQEKRDKFFDLPF